jgi:hypothetical protein
MPFPQLFFPFFPFFLLGQNTSIIVNWAGYFMNKAHEDGHYNNEIQTFKPQFEDLEDDGILYTRK